MQLLSGALHLGPITDPLLRWPDKLSASLRIWPSASSAGSKQFRQKKNDSLCPAILTIQITASNVSLCKIVSDFIVRGTFCDFYQGFSCYRSCKHSAKDFYEAASLRAPARLLLWVVSFHWSVFCEHVVSLTGFCSKYK